MGMNFRKSFKFGPFRTTISKSGVSTSVGVKGARITKRADGRTQGTLGIPGTGIYYTEEISTKPSATERPVGNQSSHGEAEENGGCFVLFVKACFVLVALFFIGIAVLLSSVFWFEGSDSPRATEPPSRVLPVITTAPTAPSTTAPAETAPLGSIDNPYGPGMYKIGVDLPAGEYSFAAYSGNGYVCVSADSNQNDILENENFSGTFIITVVDGQYLEVSRCDFVRAADVVSKINDDGTFSDGMYRVGIDIPAGEYKLTADGNGYYCIYPNSVPPFDIIDNDLFDVSTYVTVKDGQYLLLSRCTAVPVK